MRALLLTFLMLWALPLSAACTGPNFLDRLTPDERARLDAAVAEIPYATGLIFDAVRGDKRLTVVGTIHIYDPRLDAIRARVLPDIQSADILLVEASADDTVKLQNHITSNPELMFLPDGPTLPELLDEPTWQMLAEAASARQIPSFMAAKMQPWFLSISLAVAPCAMAEIQSGSKGLDFMLMDDAALANVPVRSLEHWSLLIDLMRADPLDEQIDALKLGLLPLDLQTENFVTTVESYLSGDVAVVWESSRIALSYVPGLDMARGQELFEEATQMLLTDRNHNWMPVIADAMQTADTAVIAVGAAHLPGDDGVLRLLEADGWTITPRN